MRITQIQIDRFDGWRDAALELPPGDMQVLYGPNETGKSTLLRFVRGVLFGFPRPEVLEVSTRTPQSLASGSLRIVHAGEEFVLRRESTAGGTGRLSVVSATGEDLPASRLNELLGGVDAEMYQSVFALGLPELQEVATLGGEEVARYIYDVSLGPVGGRLQRALRDAGSRRCGLLDDSAGGRGVISLAERLAELDAQLQECQTDSAQYATLTEQLEHLNAEVTELKAAEQDLQRQMRGCRVLERVWSPWQRKRALEAERDQLPRVASIPEGGLERLDELDLEIEDLEDRRKALRREARRLAKQAAELADRARIGRHAATVGALLRRRSDVEPIREDMLRLRRDGERCRHDAAQAMRRLGDGWDEERIARVNGTPAGGLALFRAAETYRRLLHRRSREVRRYQRSASRLQQQQQEIALRCEALATGDPEQATAECREQLALLEQLRTDEARAVIVEQARDALAEQLTVADSRRRLPRYVSAVLGAFGVLGLVLVVAGIAGAANGSVGHVPWLVGLIFVLLGGACGGIAWHLRRRLAPDGAADRPLQEFLAKREQELADLQGRIDEQRASVVPTTADGDEDDPRTESFDVEALLNSASERLRELERLATEQSSVLEKRQALSRFRERIRQTQRAVSAARRDWCRALQSAGLEESVRVDGPLEQWRCAADAHRAIDRLQSVSRELERQERIVREFETEVRQASREVDGDGSRDASAAAILDEWDRRLKAWEAARTRRTELRKESRSRRRAAGELADQLSVRRQERGRHLAEAGAVDRDDFQVRERAFFRRTEMERELAEWNAELEAAVRSEPELAIVESDLESFDAEQNRRAIETLSSQLKELAAKGAAHHETIGRLRQELERMESDRRPVALRFERAQVEHELVAELEAWCAVDVVAAALEAVGSELEQSHQPQTLRSAEAYLSRLTRGRYGRVWARLGEKRLIVEEQGGRPLTVEQLSAGAREQLLLAIRLALIDRLRDRGVHLPVILDDVLVNFDEARTDAAVDTLMEVSSSGQQVLFFTCHRHLARRFETSHAALLSLPPREPHVPQLRVG